MISFFPNIEFIFEDENDQILTWHRWLPPCRDHSPFGDHVLIVCNWSKETTYETYDILNVPRNGKWYEWLNDDKEYIVENNKLVIDNLVDHTARIFIYKKKRNHSTTESSSA